MSSTRNDLEGRALATLVSPVLRCCGAHETISSVANNPKINKQLAARLPQKAFMGIFSYPHDSRRKPTSQEKNIAGRNREIVLPFLETFQRTRFTEPVSVTHQMIYGSRQSLALLLLCLTIAPLLGCRQLAKRAQLERDEIHMLLAYAVAQKDWQSKTPDRRGYNIASILVSTNGEVVHWGRNANFRTQNSTQHGEVRLLQDFLARQAAERRKGTNAPSSHLQGYTVFTTLEPCAMCASMMTLLNVERTVYGQSDPEFGRALERLQLDSASLAKLRGQVRGQGYPPYPRPVRSQASRSEFRRALDAAFSHGEKVPITDFLYSAEAKELFERATQRLLNFQPRYQTNQHTLGKAKDFLLKVPDKEPPLRLDL